jgi:ribokinase
MPLARQRAWAEHLGSRPGTTVSLDPHESVREDNLATWLETLRDVDVFFAAEDELRLQGADSAPGSSLRRLAQARLDLVAFKRGACGGLLFQASGERFHEWLPSPVTVVDPTGAGDAFAGGFLAGLIADAGLERALQQGAVSAGFAIEDWGARGLLSTTREQAEQRRRQWFDSAARLG